VQKNDHNIGLQGKGQFFRRKCGKIAENYRKLQKVTESYRKLQKVTENYRKL
jgi:hypothetical protein